MKCVVTHSSILRGRIANPQTMNDILLPSGYGFAWVPPEKGPIRRCIKSYTLLSCALTREARCGLNPVRGAFGADPQCTQRRVRNQVEMLT